MTPCNQVEVSEEQTLSIFTESKKPVSNSQQAELPSCFFDAHLLLDLLFDLEDGGSAFLRNFGELLPDYPVSHPRRQYCSQSLISESHLAKQSLFI
jgi:hypothetical protein